MTRQQAGLRLLAGLTALFFLAIQRPSLGDDQVADSRTKPAQIIDSARMFGADALRKAEETLGKLAKEASLPVLVETVPSLRGQTIEELSLQRAVQTGREGIYVLLARDEHKIEVRVSRRYKKMIDEAAQRAIRDAFVSSLRSGEPDRALESGVKTIQEIALKSAPEVRPLARDHDGTEPLVIRNQVRLTLAGARRIIAGAEAKAAEMNLKVNIAVVDDGGHLLSFARMDGARPASGYTAMTKAVTAATFRQESGPMPRGAATPDMLLSLSLQNAAAASGGKLTTLHGGVPVLVEEQVIGGVGVGGGTGEQDAQIAKAGIASFLKQMDGARVDAPAARDGVAPAR